MITCAACRAEVPETSRFCLACGAPLSTSGHPTRVTPPDPSSARPISSDPQDRFVPGTVLAGRYRIFGLLGRGGMGEVYRADDLKLAQPVALKFLPPGLAGEPDPHVRLRAEVRLARQVAH